jgi:hypothetical protein
VGWSFCATNFGGCRVMDRARPPSMMAMRSLLVLALTSATAWAEPPALAGTFEVDGGLALGQFPGGGDGEAAIMLPAAGVGLRGGAAIHGRIELEANAGLLVTLVRIGHAGLGARVYLGDRFWVGGGLGVGADFAGRQRNVGPGYAVRVGFVLSERPSSRINLVFEGLFFRLGKDKDDIQTPEIINTNSVTVQLGYQWF